MWRRRARPLLWSRTRSNTPNARIAWCTCSMVASWTRRSSSAMWSNYFAAALHNLFRNGAYAAINILGLAIGFTAALLIALYVRDELSYDARVPHADRIYRLSMTINGPSPAVLGNADSSFGPAMELEFPEVEFATRLHPGSGYLPHGSTSVWS